MPRLPAGRSLRPASWGPAPVWSESGVSPVRSRWNRTLSCRWRPTKSSQSMAFSAFVQMPPSIVAGTSRSRADSPRSGYDITLGFQTGGEVRFVPIARSFIGHQIFHAPEKLIAHLADQTRLRLVSERLEMLTRWQNEGIVAVSAETGFMHLSLLPDSFRHFHSQRHPQAPSWTGTEMAWSVRLTR